MFIFLSELFDYATNAFEIPKNKSILKHQVRKILVWFLIYIYSSK